MNCLTRLFKRMTLTQEIGLRDVLIPLECVIHLNSELKISQSSQTTSLVPSEKTNLTSIGCLIGNGSYAAAYPLHEELKGHEKAKQSYIGHGSFFVSALHLVE
nr:uncharacterized protein LOC131790866 isoform X2 [Pocillopora verrucosa]